MIILLIISIVLVAFIAASVMIVAVSPARQKAAAIRVEIEKTKRSIDEVKAEMSRLKSTSTVPDEKVVTPAK